MPDRSNNYFNSDVLNKFTGHSLSRPNGKHDVQNSINLTYAGARYLDPEIGQWLSVDPMAAKFPEWSLYNYTMGNPIRLVDPDGRAATDPSLFYALKHGGADAYNAQNEVNKTTGAGTITGVGLFLSPISTAVSLTTEYALDNNPNYAGAAGRNSISVMFTQIGKETFGVKGAVTGAFLGEIVGGFIDREVSGEEHSSEAIVLDGITGSVSGVARGGQDMASEASNTKRRILNSGAQSSNSAIDYVSETVSGVKDFFNSWIQSSSDHDE